MSLTKKCVAEFVGTMLLVVFGCGVAVAAALLYRYLEGKKQGKAESAETTESAAKEASEEN